MNREQKELWELVDKGRPWYLNGYAEIFVLVLIPLSILFAALWK